MHKLLVPALLVLFSAQAHALSCIEPKLDQKTYDSAVLVFEGHLTPDTEVHADDHGHGEEIKTYTSQYQTSSFQPYHIGKSWFDISHIYSRTPTGSESLFIIRV